MKEEFDEMIDIIRTHPTDSYLPEEIAEEIKSAGYRKAEEVRKEITKKIIDRLESCMTRDFDGKPFDVYHNNVIRSCIQVVKKVGKKGE